MPKPSFVPVRLGVPLVAVLLAFVAAGDAQAQWKWRDRSGQIHVSDLPPPRDVADKDVLQRPATAARPAPAPAPAPATEGDDATPAAVPPAEAKPRVDAELEARRKAAEQEQQARQQAQQKQDEMKLAQQRAENCDRARAHLRQLESGMRMARVNDKGERIIIDDKERASEMQRARQVIASDCR
jgi:hypothetical protein